MSADDSEIARLLGAARQADLPDAARLAAVRARLLPPTAAGNITPQPSAGVSAVATPGLLAAKIALVVAVAVAGAGAWLFRHPPDAMHQVPLQHEPTRSATQSVAPAPDAPSPAGEAVEPTPPETAAPTASPTPTQPTAKRKPRAREPVTSQPTAVAQGSTLNAEASLLRLATLALRAGRLDEARNNLALFAQRYPDSQLNAERERLERRTRELEATQPRAWTVKPAP